MKFRGPRFFLNETPLLIHNALISAEELCSYVNANMQEKMKVRLSSRAYSYTVGTERVWRITVE